MSKVKNYLSQRYNESNWRFHGVNKLFYDLKDEAVKDDLREEIRVLRKSGLIDIVGGCNGYLIEIKNVNEFKN